MQISVGRSVVYRVRASDNKELRFNGLKEGDLLPALVVRVWSDLCVNLKVFTDGPVDVWKTSVTRGSAPGQWTWDSNG